MSDDQYGGPQWGELMSNHQRIVDAALSLHLSSHPVKCPNPYIARADKYPTKPKRWREQ